VAKALAVIRLNKEIAIIIEKKLTKPIDISIRYDNINIEIIERTIPSIIAEKIKKLTISNFDNGESDKVIKVLDSNRKK
jgi:hypothetical protein